MTVAFKITKSLAKDGDFVYIYYSRHDTREKPAVDDEFFNKNTGDMALVLPNGGKDNHVRYL